MEKPYDVIVIGARCGGSPLAMLLARKGYRVLVVDKATFPSDIMSTHVVQPQGVEALSRWGLLDRLTAIGCPPIHTFAYDFGPISITGSPGTKEFPVAYCPRRISLDKILVDAAASAGAEVREGFSVDEILSEDGRVVGIKSHTKAGASITERARVVVGADGKGSLLAETVGAERYHERPPLMATYYSYWSGLPMAGRFEIYIRPNRGFAAVPTNDGLTCVMVGWPHAEFDVYKKDPEANFLKTLDLAPAFAERLRAGKREERLVGAAVPNFFRKPFGPGWVLIGDAGYIKDPITAQGICNAFRDAEHCAAALDQSFTGAHSFEQAMSAYQQQRDQDALPMYELTCHIATLQPPPPEMQQLLGAAHGNQSAMDGFVRMNAGTLSPAQFMSPENIGAIMSARAARSAAS